MHEGDPPAVAVGDHAAGLLHQRIAAIVEGDDMGHFGSDCRIAQSSSLFGIHGQGLV